MNQAAKMIDVRSSSRAVVAKCLRHGSVLAAVAFVCGLSLARGVEVPLRVPWLLAIVGLAGWLHTTNRTVGMLQMIVCLYLCFLAVNQVLAKYVEWFAWGRQVNISYGLVMLAIIGIGRGAGWLVSRKADPVGQRPTVAMPGWPGTLAVLAVHMLVLWAALGICYGYGFERSPIVIGYVSLFYMACIGLWQTLAACRWRRAICLILVAYYGCLWAGWVGKG